MSANGNANDYVTMATFNAAVERIDAKFDKIDERFAKVDERFEKIDERFAKIDERFDKLEAVVEKRTTDIIDFFDESLMAARKELTDYARWKIEDELKHRHGIKPSPDGRAREEALFRFEEPYISRYAWVNVQHQLMLQREHREMSRRREEQFDRRLSRLERARLEGDSSLH